jgi:hypothetical protein
MALVRDIVEAMTPLSPADRARLEARIRAALSCPRPAGLAKAVK